MSSWRLTSPLSYVHSLRRLQPLKRIVCRQQGLCGECPWVISLPQQRRDSVTDRLRCKVEDLLAAETVQLQAAPETSEHV
jgi:hypothetical protein